LTQSSAIVIQQPYSNRPTSRVEADSFSQSIDRLMPAINGNLGDADPLRWLSWLNCAGKIVARNFAFCRPPTEFKIRRRSLESSTTGLSSFTSGPMGTACCWKSVRCRKT